VRTLVVGGTASSGKSSVILWLAPRLSPRPGVAKVDCIETADDAMFRRRGLPSTSVLAGRFCPDHALFEEWAGIEAWAEGAGVDPLIVETAGLCGRCAPYLRGSTAVCVVDCTAGIHGPGKLGPLLADADLCAATKGDLVSQAEREVFAMNVRARNPSAPLVWVNGLTGEGASDLVRALGVVKLDAPGDGRWRTPLPQLYCSYCLGRTEAGIAAL